MLILLIFNQKFTKYKCHDQKGHSQKVLIMNENVKKAVLILQQKSKKAFYSSPYHTEVISRAIDYLLRNLDLNKPPKYLIRNAIANTKKTVNNRQRICPTVSSKFFSTEYIPNRHSHNQAIAETLPLKIELLIRLPKSVLL